ncbi:MAG: hypothetical protein GY762_07925 [Proteobacteria bacterium]|nr:hypothetical protein [Pseudomonadota bacterium]
MALDFGRRRARGDSLFPCLLRGPFRRLAATTWGAADWLLMGASTFFCAGIIVVEAVIWHALLVELGRPVHLRDSLAIYALAQFDKYLPRHVAHHVGRVVMAREVGSPPAVTLQTMLVEVA